MSDLPFGYVMGATCIVGIVLASFVPLPTSLGLVLLVVTTAAFALWILDHLLDGFSDGFRNTTE